MARHSVTATGPNTGTVFTVTVNSATEALATEEAYLDRGYTDVTITPI